MKIFAATAALAFVASCAPAVSELPPIPDAMQTVAQNATTACGGPWVEWSRQTITSTWPMDTKISMTMRCLRDGRVVGPYTVDEGLQ
jgi:hypothetical protein